MKRILCGLLACTAATISIPGWADSTGREYNLELVRSSVRAALIEFSKQTGLQTAFYPDDPSAANIVVGPLSGHYTAEEALDRLLAASGLSFQRTNERMITVLATDAATSPRHGDRAELGSKSEERAQPEFVRLVDRRMENSAADGDGISRVSDVEAEKEVKTSQRERKEMRQKIDVLAEVVVTGTQIHGIENDTSPVAVYDRVAIDRSGYGTTQDFVRSLTQNFKGGSNGASEDGILTGMGINNMGNASGVNLRGLGNSSTLVLVNGHRVAASMFGAVVDLGMFPLEAIDRLEVLTDGSSAIYGADAIGGVLNVVLRKNYEGAETSLRFDTLTQGGGDTATATQTLGNSWASGSALLSFQYQDADSIGAAERPFTSELRRPVDIFPSRTRRTGLLSVNQRMTESAELFLDAMADNNSSSRDFTTGGSQPVTQRLRNATDFSSVVGGIRLSLGGDWKLEASGLFSQVYSLENITFSPSLPDYVNGTPYLRNLTTIKQGDVKVDGPLIGLRTGEVKTAIGISYRNEAASSLTPYLSLDYPSTRYVRSAFGELYIPLIAEGDSLPLVRNLTLSIAARYDSYSDFGNSTNPKFGIAWSPIDSLRIRAAYSKSFRTPDPYEEISKAQNNFVLIDSGYPLPGGEIGNVLFAGDPALLTPETARSFSAGVEYQPARIPGAKFSLNYYRVKFDNRIIDAPFDRAAFVKPEIYGPLIHTFANDADVAASVAGLLSRGYSLFDLTGGTDNTEGVRYSFPFGLINAAHVRTSGFDIGADYLIQLRGSEVTLGLSATRIEEIASGFCEACGSVDLSNVYGQPLHFRGSGRAGWSNSIWAFNAAVNYANDYLDTNVSPRSAISSYVTIDANIRYSPAAIANTTFGLNLVNAMDKDPPETAPTAFGLRYDPQNADPRGRAISLQVRHKW